MAGFLPQDPRKQREVLFHSVPILLAVIYYFFWFEPRAVEIEDLEMRVETLTSSNDAMRAIVARFGTSLPQQLAILQENVRQLEELVPRREDVPLLIHQITQQAMDLGVRLAVIIPSGEEMGTHYSKQSFELQVLGDYHSLGEYLTAIGSLPRIVRPSELKLSVEAPPEADEAPLLRAIFRIETYVMPDFTATVDSMGANAT